MAYATESELNERLGPDVLLALADDAADGVVDSALVLAALDDGASEIDMLIGGRFNTPVSPTPDILRRLNVDLAVHHLFLRKRLAISPEHVRNAATARARLMQIAEGRLDLEGATARINRLGTESTTREQVRHFDRDALDAY